MLTEAMLIIEMFIFHLKPEIWLIVDAQYKSILYIFIHMYIFIHIYCAYFFPKLNISLILLHLLQPRGAFKINEMNTLRAYILVARLIRSYLMKNDAFRHTSSRSILFALRKDETHYQYKSCGENQIYPKIWKWFYIVFCYFIDFYIVNKKDSNKYLFFFKYGHWTTVIVAESGS